MTYWRWCGIASEKVPAPRQSGLFSTIEEVSPKECLPLAPPFEGPYRSFYAVALENHEQDATYSHAEGGVLRVFLTKVESGDEGLAATVAASDEQTTLNPDEEAVRVEGLALSFAHSVIPRSITNREISPNNA